MVRQSQERPTMKQPDQNIAIPIPYEDEPQHNNNGFCGNMSHECHENQELITELNQSRLDGEVTAQESNNVYRGKTLGGW
jgi:hypothetical protein